MVSVPYNIQAEFFELQLFEMERERMDYLHADIKTLDSKGRLFVGTVVKSANAGLCLRIKKGSLPRKNTPYLLCAVANSAGLYETWNFTYLKFRNQHVKELSAFRPLGYFKDDISSKYTFVQIGELDIKLNNDLMQQIELGKKPVVVVAEDDPPILYLKNLKDFVLGNSSNVILKMPADYDFTQWDPILLDEPNRVYAELSAAIESNNITVIQGPPGTGKTFLIARLCESYMNKGARVCVTSLANKALSEVVEKEHLIEKLKAGRIRKTNISAEEKKNLLGIKAAGELHKLAKGELLLATYYQVSKLLNDPEINSTPYDVLIIEEASQSFLATLAAFCTLAKKVIVVGDPMQMSPIAVNEQSALELHPYMQGAIQGLTTFCFSNPGISYRITESRRLTKMAAYQTGVFYNETLTSKLESNALAQIEVEYRSLLCPEGGNSWLQLDIDAEGMQCNTAIEFVRKMVKAIKVSESFQIAVLSPYKAIVGSVFNSLLSEGVDLNCIDVNTIDRVQGITVDFAILVLPTHHVSFCFEEKRFNVATSRSRNGTLIITGKGLDMLQAPSKLVKEFLLRCKKVTI